MVRATTSTVPPRRWWRRLLRWTGGLVLAALLVVAVLLGTLATSAGTRWVIGLVDLPSFGVTTDSIDGALLGRLEVRGLRVADADGPWLEADGIALSWRPSRLLMARLDVETLTGTNIRLSRLPASSETPPEPQVSGSFDPRLLGRLRLGALTVDGLHVGAAVLGAPFDLDISGQALATAAGGLSAELRAGWRDAPGEITVNAIFEPDETLVLHVGGFEPEGGELAKFLNVPGAPALRLGLDGEGPVTDWKGALYAEADGLTLIQSDLTLSLSDSLTAAMDARITVGPDAPPALATVAGDGISITARVVHTGPVVRAEVLDVVGPGWRLDGVGGLESGRTLDGALTLTLDEANPVPQLAGVPLGSGTLGARLSGTLNRPHLVVDMRLLETLVKTATATLTADLEGSDITVAGSGRLDGIADDRPELAPLMSEGVGWTLEGAYDGAAQQVILSALTVQSQAVRAVAQASVALAPFAVSGKAAVDADDMSVLAPLAGLPLGGVAHLDAVLTQAGETAATGTLALSLTDFGLGIPAADGLVGGSVTATTAVATDGRDVTLGDLSISTGGGVTLTGGATIGEGQALSGTLALTVPRLDAMDVDVSGGVTVGATLAGTLAAPSVGLDAASPELLVAGVPLRSMAITADVTKTAAHLKTLSVIAAGAAVDGTATMDFASGLIDGRLSATLAAGTALEGLPHLRLPSGASAVVRFVPRQGGQGADVTVEAATLSVPDSEVIVADLKATAGLNDLFGTPAGQMAVTTKTGHAAQIGWNTMELSGSFADLSEAALRLAMTGGASGTADAFTLSAAGTIGADGAARLSVLDLAGRGHRVTLGEPATVTTGPALAFAVPRLTIDDGWLSLSGTAGATSVDAKMSGRGLPLSALALLQPDYPLEGTVDADLSLVGPFPKPTGTLSLQAINVALPDADVSGIGLTANVTLSDGRASGEARLTGLSENPALLRADVPLLMPGGVPRVLDDQPLDGSVDWAGAINRLWALVPQVGHVLVGEATIQGRVGGTLAALETSLEARIDNGRYENLEWGTVLSALTASARLEPDGSVDITATASDGGTGTVAVDGRLVSGLGDAAPDLTAEVRLGSATLVRRDDLLVVLDGDLSYTGTPDAGVLAGNLQTRRVEVMVGDTFGGGVPELHIVEVNAESLGRTAKEEAMHSTPFGSAVEIAVGVTLPNQVFIRGQGLDSEWQGELHAGGTLAAMRLYGTMSVVRGGYDFLGKRFNLVSSRINFQGAERINPLLDIQAVNQQSDLTATIRVTGTPDDMQIDLQSSPALPRDEVLARVLFGRSMAQLGPGQALAVAQAAAQLTGIGGTGGGGLDFTGAIRSSLGLDVFSVGGDAKGPSVEAGKYIDDRVYVGVEQGATAGSGTVTVEIELTPRVSVETRASGETGADIGINWKFDY